jgi:hypothetical protein
MKRILQAVALLLAVGAVAFWAAQGAHRGWTQTRVMEKTVDEVTGQDIVTWQDRFVPGVDFLGGALLGAGLLAGASLLFRTKTK